jgi:hypothetical protein
VYSFFNVSVTATSENQGFDRSINSGGWSFSWRALLSNEPISRRLVLRTSVVDAAVH